MEDPTPKKRRRRSRRKKKGPVTAASQYRQQPVQRRKPQAPRPEPGGPAARSVPKGQLPANFVYGINPVAVALEAGLLKTLFWDKSKQADRLQHIHAQAQSEGVEIRPLARQGWARILPGEQHQGLAGIIAEQPRSYLEEVVEQAGTDSCVLVLDRVQDPQNLGAVLRTAAATGVDAIVLPKAGGCPITPAVHKASAGMSLLLNIVEDENLARAIDFLKDHGYWVIGCESSEGEDATTFEFPEKRVIVMGNESEGMRRLTRDSCDYLVRIPMVAGVESLNISVATGVVLYLAQADLARAAWEENNGENGAEENGAEGDNGDPTGEGGGESANGNGELGDEG
ncbi:23S rRNA (guanosine(2251)-2'-O)-methyltransferase RlmB [bacterium]|nr:23S rRNA (guanosine(2251)-2'-O)-methyltransferase RlmB [bacterium]